ncbi:RES domain-containing protein [Fictibacillus enclensis]|uniref:RES domain-containing protein n=1 Tax=Fictibacillus enclensis TaxID=1017270 RepID=A0A0V8JDQ7_9BACL|nr:RES family NAD+ phosphorylase [Fictibacillus enclensis]KSU85157.1 hypothetical protein AS030_06465 [Fictibacillus enclensis]SCB91905.1 RES domain-containing protein [Fictibacillus enclensis]
MNHDRDLLMKAYEMWSGFKEEVLYKNRFIINHEVLDYIKKMAQICRKTIEKDTILYRARQFSGDEYFLYYLHNPDKTTEKGLVTSAYKARLNKNQQTGFWGFNGEESFVPPSNNLIGDGRANPSFIKYLYTAEEPYTALVEVRPYLGSKVSVAEIRVNEPLVVADFSYDSHDSYKKLDSFEKNLMFMIMEDFSKPSDSDKRSYIPTQYVSEFIKSLGVEGIKFNSSLYRRGRNITIFNYEKCQPIGSKLYEIEDICFEAKGFAPSNQKALLHHKLEPYKMKQFEHFIKQLESMKQNDEN